MFAQHIIYAVLF